ncbi:hypothetical protein J7M28_08140, partial [bacterium]|nr:hypothetical protein [bacterium]
NTRPNAGRPKKWATPLPTSQMPLSSPAADQDGNVFVSISDEFGYEFGRVDSDGVLTSLYTEIGGGGRAGGPCIGADGTIYCHVGSKIMAFGTRRDRSIAIITDSPGYAAWLAFCVNVSVIITNAEIGTPLDCYIAYKAADSDELLFYPFWSPDPTLAAMQFRPLPGGAFFEKIEIAHLSFNRLPAGDYQLFAGLFAPGTFNAVAPIGFCTFSVVGSPKPTDTRDCTAPSNAMAQNTFDPGPVGTQPTISIRTNKDSYVSGEVLDLSIGLANEGLGVGYDLYIAAMLDDDPEGKLFFFPTWSNDRMLSVISFQPLAQGDSLPDWTIMHLELTDALPKGGYRFLAAFFHIGSFDLASEIAEAHWTLM